MVRPTIRGVDRTVIHFTCPNCQASYHAPDDAAGRQATCRACKARLRVPSQVPPPVQAPPTPVPAPAPVPTAAQPRRRSSRLVWPLIGAALCLFVGCAGGVTGTLYALRLSASMPGVNLPSLATTVAGAVDAHDLHKEFRDDPLGADKKYANKQITVSGTVLTCPYSDAEILRLRPAVVAFFNESDRAGFSIPEGTRVVVRGDFISGGDQIRIHNCKFVGAPPRRDGNK